MVRSIVLSVLVAAAFAAGFLLSASTHRAGVALPRSAMAQGMAQAVPQCVAQSGPFAWSCAGPLVGMACTQIHESADPYTWQDNFFCSAQPMGMQWSSAGAIPGMRCTQIHEAADPHTWQDNFLCVPPQLPFVFQWSSAGPVPGMSCVQWNEPSDPHTWQDNFLCYAATRGGGYAPAGMVPVGPPPAVVVTPAQSQPPAPSCESRLGPFGWSCHGPIPGMRCTQIHEAADPHTWQDNYFCAAFEIGLQWSSAGPIPGMRCTQIHESADPNTWQDNFLCVPPRSRFQFIWNSAGPIAGRPCIQWSEPSDPHTWSDNYLCW